MVFVENWPFYHVFILGDMGQKNVVYNIVERKHAFLGYNNKKLKKVENLRFLQKVNLWFWYKIGHLSIFLLKAI